MKNLGIDLRTMYLALPSNLLLFDGYEDSDIYRKYRNFIDDVINEIETHFSLPEYGILTLCEHPMKKRHQEGYERHLRINQRKTGDQKAGGMEYYYKEVLPLCTAGGCAITFDDGATPAGVFGELEWLYSNDRQIYLIHFLGDGSIEFHMTNPEEIKEKKLTIDETRKRLYNPIFPREKRELIPFVLPKGW